MLGACVRQGRWGIACQMTGHGQYRCWGREGSSTEVGEGDFSWCGSGCDGPWKVGRWVADKVVCTALLLYVVF